MGKARGVAKYGLTALVSVVYGGAIYTAWRAKEPLPQSPRQTIALVGGGLLAATLLISAL